MASLAGRYQVALAKRDPQFGDSARVRGNEQARLLMGQPALRGKAATRIWCRSCVALFVRAHAR
jgi:hypothetical protein